MAEAETMEAYEDLTESESEALEFTEAEETEIEEETLEEESEEFESEAAEGPEAGGQEAVPMALLGKVVIRQLLRRLLKVAKKLVLKMMRNTAALRKLRIACKRGPAGLCRSLCPLICRRVPPLFRFLCIRLCPIICRQLHPWVCRKVGV